MLSSEVIAEILRMQRFPVRRSARYAVKLRHTLFENHIFIYAKLYYCATSCGIAFNQQPNIWQTSGQLCVLRQLGILNAHPTHHWHYQHVCVKCTG